MIRRLLIAICLLLPLSVFGQVKSDLTEARMIDDFDNSLAVSDFVARLDNFSGNLEAEPNSRAYVVINRHRAELPGKTARTLNWVKLYLTANNRLAGERIVLIDAGVDNCPKTQLWIVPDGKTPKNLKKEYPQFFAGSSNIIKFDEHIYEFGKAYIDIMTGYGRVYVNSFKEFTDEMKKDKEMVGYIILYPQTHGGYWKPDSPSLTARMLRQIKSELVNKHQLAASKTKVVNGGYRFFREIELWLVPRGARAPIATPTEFSPKRQKSKKSHRKK